MKKVTNIINVDEEIPGERPIHLYTGGVIPVFKIKRSLRTQKKLSANLEVVVDVNPIKKYKSSEKYK